VRELAEAGARVVLLAHQGGDLEYHNYASTEPHAAVMSELTGYDVRFIDDVCGPAAREAIGRLADGDALLLDNVRFCGEELTLFERKLDSPRGSGEDPRGAQAGAARRTLRVRRLRRGPLAISTRRLSSAAVRHGPALRARYENLALAGRISQALCLRARRHQDQEAFP
jgi:hypothetical protein